MPQSLYDITAAMHAYTLKTIEGRTALLSILINELQEVTKNIQVENPATDILEEITGLIGQARTLFKGEKENLLAG
ncbi:hypothetical protein [Kiloniella sp.]|uniref:hypothetical protein n=1 Tax=Kiloniella sp. TaxID=1938587 RepID=UPI003B026451